MEKFIQLQINILFVCSTKVWVSCPSQPCPIQQPWQYGVIATPEVTGWQTLTANDRHLVVASDGISESLTSQGVCDLIRASESNENSKFSSSCLSSSSLAECIVDTAFEEGSMDNLSAIVVPTRLAGDSQNS